MLLNRNEAIVLVPSEIQDLLNSLSKTVEQSQYPGKVEVGGDISEKIRDFFNYCFSFDDFPTINNALGIFKNVPTARKIIDHLPSLEIHWVVNGFDIDKSSLWKERVNRRFKNRVNFQDDTVPVLLRLVVKNNTIAEYSGNLYIGGTYSKPNNNYGTSLRIKMELQEEKQEFYLNNFYPSMDKHTTNRFSDLDFNSRKYVKKEYKKEILLPFKSLFKVTKSVGDDIYIELFDSYRTNNSISKEDLANLCLVAINGNIINPTGIDGNEEYTKAWFEDGKYYTKVEIDGKVYFDGSKKGSPEISQKKDLEKIIEEVNEIGFGESSIRTEYDIKVSLYNPNNTSDPAYFQLGTLTIINKKGAYCGRIIRQEPMKKKEYPKPFNFELEKLMRDNVALKNIQNEFNSPIERKNSTRQKIGTEGFDRDVLSFIKDTSDFFLPNNSKGTFSFIAHLDNNKNVNVFSTKSLDSIKEWSDFIEEASEYTYSSHVVEEFVFDFSVTVFLDNKKKRSTPILEYIGNLSIVLENKNKTSMRISLKARKLNTDITRDYIPKPSIGRFNNLDY